MTFKDYKIFKHATKLSGYAVYVVARIDEDCDDTVNRHVVSLWEVEYEGVDVLPFLSNGVIDELETEVLRAYYE